MRARWRWLRRVAIDPTAPLDLFGPSLLPSLLDIVRKGQQLASSEQLAALAIELVRLRDVTGELPESLAELAAARPDEVAAELSVYRVDPDGFATLELTAARRLSDRLRGA